MKRVPSARWRPVNQAVSCMHGVRGPVALTVCALIASSFAASRSVAQDVGGSAGTVPIGAELPEPAQPFSGHIGRTVAQSIQAMPKSVRAPKGAPNVLLILTDDVGFGAASTFGGVIPTPNLTRLAQDGLIYNRFNVAAMCSPTRAALLTGRNPHTVGTGTIEEFSGGFPGYSGMIPRSAATIAEVLKDSGYATAFFGKHHNVPYTQESAAGPFDLWPNALGFDYFYGFLGGEADQFHPVLYRNTARVNLSHSGPGYILDHDLANQAIRWIHDQKGADPGRPFFVYYAPGSTHSPHQAPAKWIARFRGRFDMGWDALRRQIYERQRRLGIIPADAALTPRPKEIPSWDSLSADQKKVYERFMEVYAAQLAYQDAQVGRVIAELRRMGELRNTLVICIEGDNGASMEGTPTGYFNEGGQMFNHIHYTVRWELAHLDEMGGPRSSELYPAGWAWAMNTPFQWAKEVASHLGGTRNGMVISWPQGIGEHKHGLRDQYSYVTDIYPTILQAVGVPAPSIVNGVLQQHLDGISLVYSFDNPEAPSRRHTQIYEMLGNRAIYHDGWQANTEPGNMPWMGVAAAPPVLGYKWQLYDLANDYSQAHDVAQQYPQKLKVLQALFDREAWVNQIYPLDNLVGVRSANLVKSKQPLWTEYTYWGKGVSVTQAQAPHIFSSSFSVTAKVVLPSDRVTGVIAATGSWFGGWSFYLEDGRPVAYEACSTEARDQFRVAASRVIGPGPVTIRYAFDYDGGGLDRGGLMRIRVDGQEVARERIGRTITVSAPFGDTFDTGGDTGVPVSTDYSHEGIFPGTISQIIIEVGEQGAPARVPR